jgi:hypothetical protein
VTAPARRAGTLRCEHCLVDFPEREAVHDGERVFCCQGCRGVWRLVQEEGLGAYYETRRWDGPGTPVGDVAAREEDLSAFREAVREMGGERRPSRMRLGRSERGDRGGARAQPECPPRSQGLQRSNQPSPASVSPAGRYSQPTQPA